MKTVAASLIGIVILGGFAWAEGPVSRPASAPGQKRELLAEHETVARFTSIAFQRCRGRTAACPDNCGQSGNVASFTVVSYLAYRKTGQYGDPKTSTYAFQVDDNHKNLKIPKELAARVQELKPGDHVLLSWQHDYVTRFEAGGGSVSFPDRPITKLQKISQEEADRLTQKPADGPASGPASGPAASHPLAETVQVRVRISNQSIQVSPVDITVTIDGNPVVSKNFAVGNQHRFESFWVDLPEGRHRVIVKSAKGKARREETVTITRKMRWIDVMFWTDPAGKFTFELVGEDRPIM